jgi:hypothetical protein
MNTSWQRNGIRFGSLFEQTWLVSSFVAATVEPAGQFEVVGRQDALTLIAREALSGDLRSNLRRGARRLDDVPALGSAYLDDASILKQVREEILRGNLVVMRRLRARPIVAVGPQSPAAAGADDFGDTGADTGPALYQGKILGPAGPLVQWPFLLRRNGSPVDDRSLDGSTTNRFEHGAWISGPGGEYRFEHLGPADYAIEVLRPSGDLIANRRPPPDGIGENGVRADRPDFDPFAFNEDPVDLLMADAETG